MRSFSTGGVRIFGGRARTLVRIGARSGGLFDGLFDPEQKGRRHLQFSDLQIQMKREPGWLLDRKVAGLRSLEDFDDKSGDLSESS